MWRILPSLLFLALSLSFLSLPREGQNAAADPEPAAGAVVCPPGVYTSAPGDCLLAGPAEIVTRLASSGLIYPPLPLPAYPLPAEWSDLPYRYFHVTKRGANIYPTLEDLIEDEAPSRVLPPSDHLYVSYVDGPYPPEQGAAYLLRSGEWIRGDGARLGVIPDFRGLLFSSQPRNAFGWVLEKAESRAAPGSGSRLTGKGYSRFDVVQIFDIQPADGADWLLIGPEEWLEARRVGRVEPRPAPPEGVPGDRWIEVNLDEQTLAVYQNNRLIFATLVSSGVGNWATPPGLFQIYKKKITETMSGATEADRSDYYYLEDVPWTMYFDEDRALHGAYWHKNFGWTMSHGCVNLSVGDAHWLYEWAGEGEYVYLFHAP